MVDIIDGAVPFDYLRAVPAAPLDRFVESIWYARGTVPYTRERIAPTGSTVAVFVLGDPILQTPSDGEGQALRADRGFLIGPHDRPTINEPTGETFAVSIVTTPIGCEALFGISPATIRGQVTDLEQAWPIARAMRDALGVLVQSRTEPGEMLDLVERRLLDGLTPSLPGLDRCERAVELLESDPTRPIAEIADQLEVSHGHLDREFTRVVGLTPRSLARLLRMRRLLQRPQLWPDDRALRHGWDRQSRARRS